MINIRLYRGLTDHGLEPDATFADMSHADPIQAYAAIGRFLPVARAAFGLKARSGEGIEVEDGVLFDGRVLDLYRRFLAWRVEQRKGGDGPPADGSQPTLPRSRRRLTPREIAHEPLRRRPPRLRGPARRAQGPQGQARRRPQAAECDPRGPRSPGGRAADIGAAIGLALSPFVQELRRSNTFAGRAARSATTSSAGRARSSTRRLRPRRTRTPPRGRRRSAAGLPTRRDREERSRTTSSTTCETTPRRSRVAIRSCRPWLRP